MCTGDSNFFLALRLFRVLAPVECCRSRLNIQVKIVSRIVQSTMLGLFEESRMNFLTVCGLEKEFALLLCAPGVRYDVTTVVVAAGAGVES